MATRKALGRGLSALIPTPASAGPGCNRWNTPKMHSACLSSQQRPYSYTMTGTGSTINP